MALCLKRQKYAVNVVSNATFVKEINNLRKKFYNKNQWQPMMFFVVWLLYIVTKSTFYKLNNKKVLSLRYKICLSFILL